MSIKQHLTYEDDQIKLHTNLTGVSSTNSAYDLEIIGGEYDSTNNKSAASITARSLLLTDHTNTDNNLHFAVTDDGTGYSTGVLRLGGSTTSTGYTEITKNGINTGEISTNEITAETAEINDTVTASGIIVRAGGNITVGSDDEYGTVTAGTFYAMSDQRLKTDITSAELSYVNIISGIDLKEFTFINDPDHIKYVGVIAQDLQEVLPEAVRDSIVTETTDGYLAVNEGKLGYITLGAVQELIAKNKELERRLEKLEQTVEQLLTNK